MGKKLLLLIVGIVVAVAVAMLGVVAAQVSAATIDTAKVCGLSGRLVQESSGENWVYSRANAYDDSGQTFCINGGSGPGFTVDNNLRYTGLWQAYPFVGLGCAYELCSRSTDLPKKVNALAKGANVSYSWRGVNAGGYWNASLDAWFDKTGQIANQDNGAELMVWLKTPKGYTGGQRVKIGHRWYWFIDWRAHHGKYSWWYIQFRTVKTVMGVRQLWVGPFIKFLEKRGLVKKGWYLTSVHAGFEMVSGGKGLRVKWFNAHV